MVFELLKKAIEQKNPFMTEDIIRLQIEFFYTAGRLTQEEYDQLIAMITPEEPEQPQE